MNFIEYGTSIWLDNWFEFEYGVKNLYLIEPLIDKFNNFCSKWLGLNISFMPIKSDTNNFKFILTH